MSIFRSLMQTLGLAPSGIGQPEAPAADVENQVHCGTHGTLGYGLVCQHLSAHLKQPDAEPVTYYLGESDPDDPERTDKTCIWCAQCDAVLAREGDWTDAATDFADPQIACDACLAEVTARNMRGD